MDSSSSLFDPIKDCSLSLTLRRTIQRREVVLLFPHHLLQRSLPLLLAVELLRLNQRQVSTQVPQTLRVSLSVLPEEPAGLRDEPREGEQIQRDHHLGSGQSESQ